MIDTNALIEVIVSLMAGGIVGFVTGFSLAAHPDIQRGVRPHTTNRLLSFMCRETKELNLAEGLVLLLLLLGWLVLFFALCALPAVVAVRLGDGSDRLFMAGYPSFAIAWWLLRNLGARAWIAMT